MFNDFGERDLYAALVPVGPLAAAVARVERLGGFERGEAALRRRGCAGGVTKRVEVESIRECASALKAKPEWIMLDNMSIADMKKCVKMCKGISKTEASGGITLERAKEVAATGVTAISLGCLTHSAGSVDLSLEWRSVKGR